MAREQRMNTDAVDSTHSWACTDLTSGPQFSYQFCDFCHIVDNLIVYFKEGFCTSRQYFKDTGNCYYFIIHYMFYQSFLKNNDR